MKRAVIVFIGFVLATGISCSKHKLEIPFDDGPEFVVEELNNTIRALTIIASIQLNGNTVTSFNVEKSDNGVSKYLIVIDDGREIRVNNSIKSSQVTVPSLSFGKENGELYWILNSEWMVDEHFQKVSVFDTEKMPFFIAKGNDILYSLGVGSKQQIVKLSNRSVPSMFEITYDSSLQCILLSFASGVVLSSIISEKFADLKRDVLNQAFYKDLFLDAGIGLTYRKSLYAAKALGLTLEGITFPSDSDYYVDAVIQNEIIAGNVIDNNGRLLYPDGEPRFKVLFVNGGSSTTHGKTIGEIGLDNMRRFVLNGGGYVGTCAGAFFVSNGYDSNANYPYYLNLWPALLNHTGISNEKTDMTVEDGSPLLDYYDFGGDMLIRDVRHNKGGYPADLPVGTEVLARFSCPSFVSVDKKPCVWAYKSDNRIGRIVMESSHPEDISSGERLDLTAAMIRYAMDGCGAVRVKGYLENGRIRRMDKNTTDNLPAFTRIGDLQCHHFAVYIPENAKNVSIVLDSPGDISFRLMLCQDTYAFDTTAMCKSFSYNGKAEMHFPCLDEGIWYIGVQCLTSVTSEEIEYGQVYCGRTDVLNGIPYSIIANWD